MNSSRNNDTSSPVAEPSPLLSSSLPAPSHRQISKRRHYHTGDGLDSVRQPVLSASIPLPKSHIHRTPSELQLADDMRRAEYEDVRMYARLVVGMQSQCMVSGYVHPLTKKSLQDIFKTKQADEEDLLKVHEEQDLEDDDDDWELFYDGRCSDDQERDDGQGSVDTPLPCHPMGTSAKAPTVVKTPSNGSIVSNLSNAPQETRSSKEDDECVFSLEL